MKKTKDFNDKKNSAENTEIFDHKNSNTENKSKFIWPEPFFDFRFFDWEPRGDHQSHVDHFRIEIGCLEKKILYHLLLAGPLCS